MHSVFEAAFNETADPAAAANETADKRAHRRRAAAALGQLLPSPDSPPTTSHSDEVLSQVISRSTPWAATDLRRVSTDLWRAEAVAAEGAVDAMAVARLVETTALRPLCRTTPPRNGGRPEAEDPFSTSTHTTGGECLPAAVARAVARPALRRRRRGAVQGRRGGGATSPDLPKSPLDMTWRCLL